MENTEYYLEMFYNEIMNSILSAPTDEATIEYLSTCLKEAFEDVLNSFHNEVK